VSCRGIPVNPAKANSRIELGCRRAVRPEAENSKPVCRRAADSIDQLPAHTAPAHRWIDVQPANASAVQVRFVGVDVQPADSSRPAAAARNEQGFAIAVEPVCSRFPILLQAPKELETLGDTRLNQHCQVGGKGINGLNNDSHALPVHNFSVITAAKRSRVRS